MDRIKLWNNYNKFLGKIENKYWFGTQLGLMLMLLSGPDDLFISANVDELISRL